jgi:hypothetical protein
MLTLAITRTCCNSSGEMDWLGLLTVEMERHFVIWN